MICGAQTRIETFTGFCPSALILPALLGENMVFYFSASKSPFSHLMQDYVEAEKAGRGVNGGPAECWPYMKDCPKSIFMPRHSPYRCAVFASFNRRFYSFFSPSSQDMDNEVTEEEIIHNPAVGSM